MIYYVAFYNPEEEVGKRVANYAGEDKIDYICESLNQIGESVTILSNTKSLDNKYQGKKTYIRSENKKIVCFSSLSNANKIIHAIDVIWGFFQLGFFLFTKLRKNDVVLVYHSLGYRKFFNYFAKIKKFKYILEVEELFQYIDNANSYKRKENEVFSIPNSFIFSNAILQETVNHECKPYVVINGVYRNEVLQKPDRTNGKTHVLYAGSLEPQKGVDYVIKSAEFLSGDYEMKIIGFGSEKDIKRINELIEKTNRDGRCHVTYDGVYKGNDYLNYIHHCDIGVCIQNPDDTFNLYEFPSKIFSYMSNGLKVVTNRLEQIEKSSVAPFLTIADDANPESVAKAITLASSMDISSKDILNKLDATFKNELRQLIKGE